MEKIKRDNKVGPGAYESAKSLDYGMKKRPISLTVGKQ